MNIENLSSNQLRRAAQIKDQIAKLQTELSRILGGWVSSGKQSKPKRKISAAGRAKISAAAKARWAKIKARK